MPSRLKPLTPGRVSPIISPADNTLSAGSRTPCRTGVKTPHPGVFYCPQKIITPLVREFVMVARNGQPQGWPEPVPGSANPLRVAAQQFAPVGGGLPSL